MFKDIKIILKKKGVCSSLFLLWIMVIALPAIGQENIVGKPPEDDNVYTNVSEPARFPGGMDSLRLYMENRLHKLGREAQQSGVEGKVYVKFIVELDGSISNVALIKAIDNCSICNEETVKAVKEMPLWTPARNSAGVLVRSQMLLPVIISVD